MTQNGDGSKTSPSSQKKRDAEASLKSRDWIGKL